MSLLRVGERNDSKHVHYGQHLPLQSEAGAQLPTGSSSLAGRRGGGGGGGHGTRPVVEDGQLGAGPARDSPPYGRVAAPDVVEVDPHQPEVLVAVTEADQSVRVARAVEEAGGQDPVQPLLLAHLHN